MRKPMRITLISMLVIVTVLVAGNLTIFAASMWAKHRAGGETVVELAGVGNVRALDDKVWRGAQPSDEGYVSLADADIATVIDLRAEDYAVEEGPKVTALGMTYVHIPMRDGQAPSEEQVSEFLAAVQNSKGKVFVHCGAGVGRTGTMAAAYLVATGNADASEALAANLAVGPPSLEQLSFVSSMADGDIDRPSPLIVGFSRFLDAPRRILTRLGG